MKNKSFIITLVLLIVVLVSAVLLYPKLSNGFMKNVESESLSEELKESTDSIAQTEMTISMADDFTVFDLNGNEVKLSDYFGKPIVVNFWATWCGFCKEEFPAFENMYAEYKDSVHFLMVNQTDGIRETEGSVKKYIANEGYTFPVFFDKKFSATYVYGVYSIPETLFINAKGELVDKQLGAMSESVLKNKIEQIIGG